MKGANETDPFAPIEVGRFDHETTGPLPIHPVPAGAPQPSFRHRSWGNATAVWTYSDNDSRILGYVARFDTEEGKQISPLSWCRYPDGSERWCWKAFRVPRPLYGLDRLASSPGASVLVVEGEKTVDAAQRRFIDRVVVSWPGGSNAVNKADWSVLAWRHVVIWPDADEAGHKAARQATRLLHANGAALVRLVGLPPGLPKGWDLADDLVDGIDPERLIETAIDVRADRPRRAIQKGTLQTITEDGVALVFAERNGGRLRYCHTRRRWFMWSDFWQEDTTERVLNSVRELTRELLREDSSSVRTASRFGFVAGVERLARSDPAVAVTAEAWDQDRFLLGTPAGTVDLNTGELLEPRSEHGITKQTAAGPSRSTECPRWMAFLQEAAGGDAGLIRFLQQWAGYCLTGDVSEHALVFIYGPGGNGKGVFIRTIAKVMGTYAVAASMDTFIAAAHDRHPTELAMLHGARLVTASETEEGRHWAESRIKQLTGGDPITARYMRKDFFTYSPQFKLVITGNHKPALHHVDDAARRRFNVVPFLRKPQHVDPELEESLRAEWPGILRWMIIGWLEKQKDGFKRAPVISAATEAYFEEQDLLGQWLEELCDAEPGNEHKWEFVAELFTSWSTYARNAGEDPGSKKSFSEAMQRRGFRPAKKTKGARALLGVCLKVDRP